MVTRRKAGEDSSKENLLGTTAGPWSIGLYHTKRKHHKTSPLGEIPEETYDDVTEPIGWNEHTQLELAIECVARELEVEESFVRSRIALLQKLVPDLKPKLRTMRIGDIARLAVKVPDVATKLLKMREIFPSANISRLVCQQPTILLEDMVDVEEKAKGLKVLLETEDIDRAVELNPVFLDLAQVSAALDEIRRLMPKQNAPKYLIMNPNMLLSLQTGDNLIPYDNGNLKQLKATLVARSKGDDEGGKDASEKGW